MTTEPLKVSGAGLAAVADAISAKPEPAAPIAVASGGPAVPAWVKPDDLARATEIADAEHDAARVVFETAPATPDDYKFAPIAPGPELIPAEDLQAVRVAAHSIGLSQGEFSNLQAVLQKIEPAAGDAKMMRRQADAMGTELERRYGDKRAQQLAGYAVAAITSAKGLQPGIAAALRQEICTNRPLLEMLARVGERHAKRNT